MERIPATGRTRQRTEGTPVRLDGRTVGAVVGAEFRRTLRESHVLRLPRPSIAASPGVLDAAEQLGATIGVWTLPSGSQAVMDLAEFRERAVTIDRGHGPQLAVPLAEFFGVTVQASPPTAEQLQLFEGLA